MDASRRKALKNITFALLAGRSMPHLLGRLDARPLPGEPASQSTFPTTRSIVEGPRSQVVTGLEWLGEQIPCPEAGKRGDTFPLTWAADDAIYTSAGDPVWPDKNKSGLDVERILGNPPDYRIDRISEMADYKGWGGEGPKPTGLISVKGTLYLAFQNLTGKGDQTRDNPDVVANYGHGYDAQIVSSSDFGKSWRPDIKAISTPMFPGRTFGAPAFVNFGKDNLGARDKFVYAISGEGWDDGSHCRLGRVPEESILDRKSWEWVRALSPKGGPQWSKDMNLAVPVITHPGYLGAVDMVYISSLRRYLLLGWRNKVKADPDAGSELIVYDAPEPWGPFTIVHHEDPWESVELNPYNPRLPLKWFDHEKLEGWLLFSGSWRSGGQTPTYRVHVRKFRLNAQRPRN
jgi:hypothetical protein